MRYLDLSWAPQGPRAWHKVSTKCLAKEEPTHTLLAWIFQAFEESKNLFFFSPEYLVVKCDMRMITFIHAHLHINYISGVHGLVGWAEAYICLPITTLETQVNVRPI